MRNRILLLLAGGALAACGGLEDDAALHPGSAAAGMEVDADLPAPGRTALAAVARTARIEGIASEPFAARDHRSGLCTVTPHEIVFGIVPPNATSVARLAIDNSDSPYPCEVRRLRLGLNAATPADADFDIPPGEREEIALVLQGVPQEGGVVLSATINGSPQAAIIHPWEPAEP